MFTSGKPPRETNQKKANQMLQTQTRRQVLEEIESIKSKQKNKKSKSVKFGEIESGGITEINLDKILNNTDNEKSVKSSKKEIVKKNLIQMIKDKLTEKINSILNCKIF
ncbi:hypothetical protein MHBO_003466 [Bonamia ostreae]|uniref:Uncharacterized protein n=1 Tax=Bonamia ostreae TaxID=126728 RepID=A0ABV2AQX4_9EUKA